MGGYSGNLRHSHGIHDALYARSASFTSGDETLVLCSVDLVGVSRSQITRVKKEIFNLTHIPAANIMISATHTHSGPRSIPLFGHCVPSNLKIYEAIKASIYGCLHNTQLVEIKFGRVKIEGVGFNRRNWDVNSMVMDNYAEIIRLDNENETPLNLLYNFGIHAVVLPPNNLYYSADWPYYAMLGIKKQLKFLQNPIFFQGSSGNVNPINQPFNVMTSRTFNDAKYIGDLVAEKITHGASKLAPLNSEILLGNLQPIALAPDDPEKLDDCTWVTSKSKPPDSKVLTDLQVLQLGDIIVFGVPGELFGELSVALKKAVAPRPTWVVNYANDYIGYLPTRNAYRAGGYEAVMMGLSEDAGEEIVNSLLSMVKIL